MEMRTVPRPQCLSRILPQLSHKTLAGSLAATRTLPRKQFTHSSATRVTGSDASYASDHRVDSAIQYEDEDINHGKTKTRRAGTRGVGAWSRMHGDVAVLRPARRQGIW